MLEIVSAAFGYRRDWKVRRVWRVALKVTFVLALAAVFGSSLVTSYVEPPRTRERIRVLNRLDEYTKQADASHANTIPEFLASPGTLGALEASGTPEQPVRSVDESELRRGVCTQSIPRLVRHQYPGFYEGWSDAKLEKTVLAKHPEYQETICILPAWVDASPNDVIKYEVIPRSLLAKHTGPMSWALFVTLITALALTNAYYRVIVERANQAPVAAPARVTSLPSGRLPHA